MATGTAIRSPTDDLSNHTIVLRQLKEIAEVGQRIRGDTTQSFVRVSELVSAGIIRFVNNTVQPPPVAAVAATTVSVLDSITGDGSSGNPLKLSGDSASPGNSMLYGTNGSGTKGWYAQPSGSSGVTVTDGTHTVSSATQVTFSGATVSGTTPNATVTVSGGSTAVPGTIKDLLFWFESDDILGTNGSSLYNLGTRVPWYAGIGATLPNNSNVTVDSTTLNSLPVLSWSASSAGRTALVGNGYILSNGLTVFAIYKPASFSSSPTLFSGSSGAFQIRTNTSGVIELAKSNTAIIGTSNTGVLATGTWAQLNATYSSSGAFAFRVARAAAGSGSNLQSITSASNAIAWDPGNGGQDLNGLLAALIVYGRVLNSTEITNVENYFNTKWGV